MNADSPEPVIVTATRLLRRDDERLRTDARIGIHVFGHKSIRAGAQRDCVDLALYGRKPGGAGPGPRSEYWLRAEAHVGPGCDRGRGYLLPCGPVYLQEGCNRCGGARVGADDQRYRGGG